MFGAFGDTHSSEEANKAVCRFFDKKIAQIMKNDGNTKS
jgi:hypothetical protein